MSESDNAISGPAAWSSIRLTATAIQVLAHPLRTRLLSALRLGGPATATALADQLATNTGATSYHLRKLAAVGLVEETGEGRGRERWWRPTTDRHNWTDEATEDDPDARAAAGWLREHYLRSFVERAEHWHAHHDAWPIEWRRLAGASDYVLDLTAKQLDALLTELTTVIAKMHAQTATAGGGEPGETPQRVLLFVHNFPVGERPR